MRSFQIAALAVVALAGLCGVGCQTSHTETDRPTLLGGEKHTETTTYKNPITGDTTTEHKESKTGL